MLIAPVVAVALSAVASASKPERRPVVVALVDDAFEVRMPDVEPFWFRRAWASGTIRSTGVLPGWDLADRDADVRPPTEVGALWHGSAVSELLSKRLLALLGPRAAEDVRFLPIKCLPDAVERPDMSLGYEGIRLAARLGADLIVCAWSGTRIDTAERSAVLEAQARGALVVASAGNDGSSHPQYPAALPGVLSVAAADSAGRALFLSSRGPWVDLASAGDSVELDLRPWRSSPTWFSRSSRAAVEVAAVAAVLKVRDPGRGAQEIRRILMSTARPAEIVDPSCNGCFGAGIADLDAAVRGGKGGSVLLHDPRRPAGILAPTAASQVWEIAPIGGYRELRLRGWGRPPPRGALEISDGGRTIWKGPVSDLGDDFWIGCSRARIRWSGPVGRGGWSLEYRMVGIDSARLFCEGRKDLSADSGILSDGSGPFPYAHGCDCGWRIRTSPGTRIRVDFPEMDTRAGTDVVHLFNGGEPTQDQLLAMFSGARPPPPIVTPSNQLLVWFVSGRAEEHQGWKMWWRAVPDSVPVGLADPLDRAAVRSILVDSTAR